MRSLATLFVPLAGLAVCCVPAAVVPAAVVPAVVAPASTQCAGGLCDVCPAVATALTATGAQIYCVA